MTLWEVRKLLGHDRATTTVVPAGPGSRVRLSEARTLG